MATLVLAPVLLTAIVLVAAAAGSERDLVLRHNGFAGQAVPVAPGAPVCQRRLQPSESFTALRVGTPPAARPVALEAEVRRGGRVVGRGRAVADGPAHRRVRLDRPVSAGPVSVCFSTRTRRAGAVYASVSWLPTRDVTVGGRPQRLSMQLDLVRSPRSILSMAAAITDRASVMRPSGIGPWLFWALLAAGLIAVPLVLARAVTAAQAATRS